MIDFVGTDVGTDDVVVEEMFDLAVVGDENGVDKNLPAADGHRENCCEIDVVSLAVVVAVPY